MAEQNLLTTAEVCEKLSVSAATVKNWIRLGKLQPEADGVHFAPDYIEELCQALQNGTDSRLKSRRNKKTVTGRLLYKDYIRHDGNKTAVAQLLDACGAVSDTELRLILAHAAKQLYEQRPAQNDAAFASLVRDLRGKADGLPEAANALRLVYVPDDDTLGFLYLSLRSLSDRKQKGAYYTPADTVNRLLDCLQADTDFSGKTFMDPCCGTGNFLIGLRRRYVSTAQLYGADIDEISVLLTRINLFLLDSSVTYGFLKEHIICCNTLRHAFDRQYSVVLGNPPWGYSFSKEETDYCLKHFSTARKKGTESFDLFIEKGLSVLEEDGYLAYVLPEALFGVASHRQARQLLAEQTSFRFVSYLGNAFGGVQCPAIIPGLKKDGKGSTKGCRVWERGRTFTISTERPLTADAFSFRSDDAEYGCIKAVNHVPGARFLAGNADFALGIVTGNNKEHLKPLQEEGCEPVLKGNDIFRFGTREASNYIHFTPEAFQQAAPTALYRADEKLLYRFVCDTPVFAYDNRQTLTLNSANILIPHLGGLHIKYILAILNSSVAAFYLDKTFHSVKMLRAHIEALPIPPATDKQQAEIIALVDRLIDGGDDKQSVYKELDEKTAALYGLTDEQQAVIRAALQNKKVFLA